jgi:hypothetical protein
MIKFRLLNQVKILYLVIFIDKKVNLHQKIIKCSKNILTINLVKQILASIMNHSFLIFLFVSTRKKKYDPNIMLLVFS